MIPSTIRSNQALIIVLMGIAGLLMALISGNTYKQLALESQRSNMYKLLEYKTQEELDQLNTIMNDLGQNLQQQLKLRRAIQNRDYEIVETFLHNQFRQYFVTTGTLDLHKLLVFDLKFNFMAGSRDGTQYDNRHAETCPGLVRLAARRQGTDTLRLLTDNCMDNGKPVRATLVPVGGLIPEAYIMVISRLNHIFKDIEDDLGMPLQAITRDGQIRYQSTQWPQQIDPGEYLSADHTVKTKNGTDIMSLFILDDMQLLKQQLEAARTRIVLVASIITTIAMLLAFLIINRSVLMPIKKLLEQVQLIRMDRTQLGNKIQVCGNKEIRLLAREFNDMSSELGELYQSLELMAFTDPLTHLYNRAWFHEQLRKCANLSARHHSPFSVFIMDLNQFKPINDNFGHHIGDKVLETVSMRMQNAIRTEDTLARLSHTAQTEAEAEDDMIARMGGDEFAVLLPMAPDINSIKVIAQKLINVVNLPIIIDGKQFQVGISIGIAMYPNHGENLDQLLRLADEAMYRAKKKGGGYALSNSNGQQTHVS